MLRPGTFSETWYSLTTGTGLVVLCCGAQVSYWVSCTGSIEELVVVLGWLLYFDMNAEMRGYDWWTDDPV